MQSAVTASKGAVTRDSIIDRAYWIVRREGFEGLSIGTVATSVGMSKSGVFAHFGSREELQLAVLDAAAQRFTEQVFLPAIRERRGCRASRRSAGAGWTGCAASRADARWSAPRSNTTIAPA